ncbi:MAG TPA: hypothetical protein VNM92_06300 [Thermoanaerobaculia bacterium]|nr:hypothetical protein [Thermoanaerobaculia bacterium]
MTTLDEIRSKALNEVDRAQRNVKVAILGGAMFEGLFLLALLLTADLKDPTHRVILFAAGMIYMPVVMGLLALGAYVNRCTLRVLVRLDDMK